MTPEEKARAYDEALEKAKKELQTCGSTDCDAARQIYRFFPELQDSEDKRIIKWIIDDIRYNMNNEPLNNSEYKKEAEKAISWLEKQGKPKWTEEDSSMQLTLMRDIEQVSFISKEGKDERIMWLNKLDDRFHQNTNDIQKSKWTEEDDKNLESIDIILFEYKDLPKENYWKMINWLKSLKQRMEKQ